MTIVPDPNWDNLISRIGKRKINVIKTVEELTTDDIDIRSKILIEDVDAYYKDVLKICPEATRRTTFESWAIQKIASLQLYAECYASGGRTSPDMKI